jgi:hypothetical protein
MQPTRDVSIADHECHVQVTPLESNSTKIRFAGAVSDGWIPTKASSQTHPFISTASRLSSVLAMMVKAASSGQSV